MMDCVLSGSLLVVFSLFCYAVCFFRANKLSLDQLYETIPPVRLETSGGVLSTLDMMVQRSDGPRRLYAAIMMMMSSRIVAVRAGSCLYAKYTLGEVTSHNPWSGYNRRFVGITRYNVWD